jgi:hypothetical protein
LSKKGKKNVTGTIFGLYGLEVECSKNIGRKKCLCSRKHFFRNLLKDISGGMVSDHSLASITSEICWHFFTVAAPVGTSRLSAVNARCAAL